MCGLNAVRSTLILWYGTVFAGDIKRFSFYFSVLKAEYIYFWQTLIHANLGFYDKILLYVKEIFRTIYPVCYGMVRYGLIWNDTIRLDIWDAFSFCKDQKSPYLVPQINKFSSKLFIWGLNWINEVNKKNWIKKKNFRFKNSILING